MNGGQFNMISLWLIPHHNIKQYDFIVEQPRTDEHENSTLGNHLIDLEDEINEYLEELGYGP